MVSNVNGNMLIMSIATQLQIFCKKVLHCKGPSVNVYLFREMGLPVWGWGVEALPVLKKGRSLILIR